MKLWTGAVLVLLAFNATAQSAGGGSGYYERLQYREDDPFVFCTQGRKERDKCWIPLPPYTGNFMMMPYCNPPNSPYGKSWTQDDWSSLYQYQSVCPRAINSGQWEGSGRPEQTPFSH